MGKLRGADASHKKRRAKIDSGQESEGQSSRALRNWRFRRSAPARRWFSLQRIAGAAIPPRTRPEPLRAGTGFRPSARSVRSMSAEGHAEWRSPRAMPRMRTPDSRPGARPEKEAIGGCDPALPGAEPASTAPPPAHRLPGRQGPSRVRGQAPPRRWPKERVPPWCLQSTAGLRNSSW